jgi:hypothetical protein
MKQVRKLHFIDHQGGSLHAHSSLLNVVLGIDSHIPPIEWQRERGQNDSDSAISFA